MSERKTISNSFTVNTVEDGESAPYYFQEWFAWSNDSTTASVTTAPTIAGSWATSIPAQGSYAYLWRKSIRYVWNDNTRQYTAETPQYFRMSGTNGTSITPKGTVDFAYSTKSGFPPPSSSLYGKTAVAKGSNKIYKCDIPSTGYYDWLETGSTASAGDSYTVDAGNLNGNYQSTNNMHGHFIMWSSEASQWIDLGQFQGQNGKTYYTHIAWATNVNYNSGGVVTSVEGFTTDKSPNDTTHLWMGVLVDESSGADPSEATLYAWSYTKGVKGDTGNDAVIYELVSSVNVITLSEDEVPIFDQVFFSLYKTVGSNNPTIYSTVQQWQNELFKLYYVVDGVQTEVGYDYMLSYDTKVNYHDIEQLYNQYHDVTWIVKKNNSVITQLSIGVVKNGEKGNTGARGKVGRFFYFGGVFDSSNTNTSFVVNDAQAPYFEHTVDGQKRYHVFNYSTNGSYTMAQMWSISNQSWSNTPWEAMTNDFKYLITEAMFSNFAKLASAIFSGDWMLSQYGVPSRVISTTEKYLVYMCVKVDGQHQVSDLATLLDDADLWDEYKGYGYSDSELETVADICKWAVSAMPSNSDDVRYNAIQTISNTSYQLFGLNQSNLFSVFEPNISLDLLRGKAYLNDCNVKGNLTGRVSTPFTRIKNSSDWNDYGVETTDDYGYTRHYLFTNGMPTWNVQVEYMSGSTEVIRRLILPVITQETLGVEIKIVNVSGDTITVEGKPENSTYMSYGSYLLDGIQTTGYSNDQRTVEMDNQTMLKFVSVEIPTQYGEYGWIAVGEPQTIKSQV